MFFCAGGLRSALAAKTAKDMGLKPVAHILGGFKAWKEAGGPTEPGEGRKIVQRSYPRGRVVAKWGMDFVNSIRDGKIPPPPFAAHLKLREGVRFEEIAEGRIVQTWAVAAHFTLPDEIIQGGLLCAVADMSQTFALMTTHEAFRNLADARLSYPLHSPDPGRRCRPRREPDRQQGQEQRRYRDDLRLRRRQAAGPGYRRLDAG